MQGINGLCLERISKLATRSESRTACATRDVRLRFLSGTVFFKRREQNGVEPLRILLSCARFSCPPLDPKFKVAYEKALDACNGFPLMLDTAGSTANSLKRYVENDDEAWIEYMCSEARNGIETLCLDDGEVKRQIQEFRKSIDAFVSFLKEEFDSMNWSGIPETFRILRRQNAVPLHVLRRMWKDSERETERRVKRLQMFSLVQKSVI